MKNYNLLFIFLGGIVTGVAGLSIKTALYAPDIYCGSEYNGWIVVQAIDGQEEGTSTYKITDGCKLEEITLPNNVWYSELDTIGKKHVDLKAEFIKNLSYDEATEIYNKKRDQWMKSILNE